MLRWRARTFLDPDRRQLIKAQVHEALERPSAERNRWPARACADDAELFAEARTLVAAAALTGSFLERRFGRGIASIVIARC